MKRFRPLEDTASILHILSDIAIFGGVTDEQREEIFKRLEVGTFRKGEFIFRKGDEPEYIYIIKKGKIALLIAEHDVNIQKKTLETGECFGEASLMSMQRHTTTTVALEDCEVVVLSRRALLQLQQEDIQLFALLMMNIARELARRLKLTDDILFQHVQSHKGS